MTHRKMKNILSRYMVIWFYFIFLRLVGSVIPEPHTFFRGDFGRILNRVLDNWMGVMGIVVVVVLMK